MRILVDIDGVIRDLHIKVNEVYDREHPGKWRTPITKWGMHEFYEIGNDIYNFAFNIHAVECFGKAPPYSGAVEFVDKLYELGHTVVICTSQNKHTTQPTINWLYECDIKFHELYVTGQNHKKNGKQITGDVMIDDGLHNLKKFDGLKICFEQPWNEGFTDGFRTNDYNVILQCIADHQEMLIGKGLKFSKGKRMWNLLPWDTLESVVDVLTAGAEKYSPDNWKHVPNGKVEYYNSLIRHLRKLENGEFLDADSGLPGTSHMVCCALFYAWLVEQEHTQSVPTATCAHCHKVLDKINGHGHVCPVLKESADG